MLSHLEMRQFQKEKRSFPMSDSSHKARSCAPSTASANDLVRAAKLLLGCYRAGDASDPEVYVSAVVAVLSDYAPGIVQAVVDPRSGLPSTLKWLPSIAEIKQACDDLALREERKAEQLERANRLRLPEPHRVRPTREEIERKLGRPVGGRDRVLSVAQAAGLAAAGIIKNARSE